jgi:hypothetical protein
MNSLVCPPEKPVSWAIEPAEFSQEIQRRWPGAAVSASPGEWRAMEWTAATPRGECQFALTRQGQALLLEGDIEDCAEVALWFRSLVPSDITLLFYDEAFNADVSLHSTTTVDEIIRPFLA